MIQEIVTTYELVSDTVTNEMIALRPTADLKLTQVITKAAVMTVQSAA